MKFFYCFKCTSSRAGRLPPLYKSVINPILPIPGRSDGILRSSVIAVCVLKEGLYYDLQIFFVLIAEYSVNDKSDGQPKNERCEHLKSGR